MLLSTGSTLARFRPVPALALAAALSLSSLAPALANSADFVRGLWPQAEARGVSRSAFDAAFSGYNYIPKIMELTQKQPEFSQTVQQYIDKRVTAAQVQKGQAMRVSSITLGI